MTGVAKVHDTTLTPTKIELLQDWLPRQSWFEGSTQKLNQVASYRFVDPEGKVGLEGLILQNEVTAWHIPLSYRSGPLEGIEPVGTLLHGVLGQRWVYFGPDDEVYRQVITDAIRHGHTEADYSDGRRKTAFAIGSGLDTDTKDSFLSTTLRIDNPIQGKSTLSLHWGEEQQNSAIINSLTLIAPEPS